MEITYHVPLFIIAWFLQMGLHEGGHAYAAFALGDDTASLMGKRSFNPLAHVEWDNFNSILMSVIIPSLTALGGYPPMGMAWVPVNPRRFKKPSRDHALVSFAGPLGNFVLMALCLMGHIVLGLFPQVDMSSPGQSWTMGSTVWLLDQLALHVYLTSALYGLFNLLPIPPLDGSMILRHFLPYQAQRKYDELRPYGMMILIVLFWIGNGGVVLNGPLTAFMMVWAIL